MSNIFEVDRDNDTIQIGDTETVTNIPSGCKLGVGTASPSVPLQVSGESRLGSAVDYMKVESDGDVDFVGGSGLVFGSMYNHDTTTLVTIDSIGVSVRVPSSFTEGQSHNVTFQNSREIAVGSSGKYMIVWQISFTSVGSNQEIESGVMVNNTINTQATSHLKVLTGTDTSSVSGNCILSLSSGDVISLGMLNETSTSNLNVEHANMSLVKLGG